MPTIVISYRRADAAGTAGRMFDKLVSHFGDGHVFMDIDSIPAGTNFRRYLRDILSRSDIVLAVIGPRWMGEGGRRRISEDSDLVRFEVQTALEQNIPLIPVLVDHADMPRAEDLPAGLQDIVDLNAVEVGPGRDFHVHMDRLIRSIEALLRAPKPVPEVAVRAVETDDVSTETEPPTEPAVARLLRELSESAITVGKSAADPPADRPSSPPEESPGASSALPASDEQRVASRADDDEAAVVPDFLQSRRSASAAGDASPQLQASNDNPPRGPGRWRSLVAVALIGCVALATAGAYALRSYYAVPSTSNQPPVITADKAPTKAAPAVNAENGNQTPPFLGEIFQNGEQTVAREKQAEPARAVAASPPPSKSVRTVAIRPDKIDSGPTASASLPNAAVTGGYFVQVSSQKSEEDAQASYRSQQAKYPNQLAGRSAVIRRADLGDKGVFYRAGIGPFASSEEANQFCSELKAAGGQCVVQRY